MKQLHTLKFKITLASFLMLLTSFVIFDVLAIITTKQQMIQVIEEKSIHEVRQIAKQASLLLEKGAEADELQAFVENQIQENDYIAYAIIIDKAVNAVAHSDRNRIGKSYSDDAYTVDGAVNGQIKTSTYYADLQESWAYDTMVPIYVNHTLYGTMDVGIYDSYVSNVSKSLVHMQVLLTTIIVLGVSLLLAFICNYLLAPLKQVTESCRVISKGDLSQAIDAKLIERKDEIGMIANAIDNIQISIGEILRASSTETKNLYMISETVTTNCQNAKSASNNILMTIKQFVEGSQQQSELAIETNQMTDEINSGIENAAQSIQTASEVCSKTVDQAAKGGQDIALVIEQMNLIQAQTTDTSVQIQLIKDKAMEIEKIVALITDIASQTNLLALNATIEAARAGEAGKGFNVVATEITHLAEQCSEATNHITGLITDTHQTITDATQVMLVNAESVTKGVVVAEYAGTGFKEILEAIHHISSEVTDISAVVEEISASTTTLLSSSTQISNISNEATEHIENIFSLIQAQDEEIKEVNRSADELVSVSESLKQSIDQFIL